ncbi:MAG: hypothetical protein C0467_10315 [Planctomycetaceae bacterium]|nr:hypothetical protein [Planctomycetaceae bacterium]
MDNPDDDHLTRSMTELGDPEALFRISRGRFLAKLTLGILLLAYGVVANYFWWVHGPGGFGHLELLLLIVVPLSGGALLIHMYRQRGLFVLIYPTGLLRLRRGEVDSFPWREVDHVRVNVQRADEAEVSRGEDGELLACWLPADVPTFQLWKAGLTISRDDGVTVHFGPALTDYGLLAEEVQRRTFHAIWPLVWANFLAGRSISFGDIEASRAGVRYANKFLPWADVKELSVAQGKLSIKQGGKWLPWVLVDVNGIPNPHVLFALAIEARRTTVSHPEMEPKSRRRG